MAPMAARSRHRHQRGRAVDGIARSIHVVM
jgi:hypothetical protein